MKQLSKVLLMTLVIVLIILVPACRTRKTPPPTTTVDTTAPPIPPPPPPPTDTEVTPSEDFIKEEPEVTPEVIPSDIDEVNKWAVKQGHIRDAFFNYDEATLDDAAQSALTASANWLKGRDGAGFGVLVEGHCDERGTEQYNLALGDRRANTAKDYLVTLGVDARRIRTVSYGEERPFEEGHDETSWAQNRRAHLILVR